MRPDRFVNLLVDAVGRGGKLSAHSYPQAGITTSLWGLVVRNPQVTARVQVCARSALGDDYAQPEHIVTDNPHPPLAMTYERKPMRDIDLVDLRSVERYLAARAVDMAPQEISGIHLHGARDKPPNAIPHGFTVYFHDGSAIFAYITASK